MSSRISKFRKPSAIYLIHGFIALYNPGAKKTELLSGKLYDIPDMLNSYQFDML